jgi:hypothetical protein
LITPAELLASLRGAGFSLRPDGDRIVVSPASALTPEQRQAIADAKPELMHLLLLDALGDKLRAAAKGKEKLPSPLGGEGEREKGWFQTDPELACYEPDWDGAKEIVVDGEVVLAKLCEVEILTLGGRRVAFTAGFQEDVRRWNEQVAKRHAQKHGKG